MIPYILHLSDKPVRLRKLQRGKDGFYCYIKIVSNGFAVD